MSYKKLHDSSHPNPQKLDELYNNFLKSCEGCNCSGCMSFLYSQEGCCLSEPCKTEEAYKANIEALGVNYL